MRVLGEELWLWLLVMLVTKKLYLHYTDILKISSLKKLKMMLVQLLESFFLKILTNFSQDFSEK